MPRHGRTELGESPGCLLLCWIFYCCKRHTEGLQVGARDWWMGCEINERPPILYLRIIDAAELSMHSPRARLEILSTSDICGDVLADSGYPSFADLRFLDQSNVGVPSPKGV